MLVCTFWADVNPVPRPNWQALFSSRLTQLLYLHIWPPRTSLLRHMKRAKRNVFFFIKIKSPHAKAPFISKFLFSRVLQFQICVVY